MGSIRVWHVVGWGGDRQHSHIRQEAGSEGENQRAWGRKQKIEQQIGKGAGSVTLREGVALHCDTLAKRLTLTGLVYISANQLRLGQDGNIADQDVENGSFVPISYIRSCIVFQITQPVSSTYTFSM